jgi:exonuclease III
MRLVTWNCNTSPQITRPDSAASAFTAKYTTIFKSIPSPDVIVCQEIARPASTSTHQHVWYGPLLSRGICVSVAEQYRIESHYDESVSRSIVPVTIHGPNSFHLLGVWSIPHKPSMRNYVREVYDGIRKYQHLLTSGPCVVIGDFNSNARWDGDTGALNHTRLVQMLETEFGLISSYHTKCVVAQGEESEYTFYRYRQQTQGFHIDYCFIPRTWTINDVQIGSFENWYTHSDHCPLIVDLSL